LRAATPSAAAELVVPVKADLKFTLIDLNRQLIGSAHRYMDHHRILLTHARKKMVDFSLSIPLIISSGLAAPVGSYLNVRLDTRPFLFAMAIVLALAGVRMLLPSPQGVDGGGIEPRKKIIGGIVIGACIGLVGGLLGIGGGVFIVPLLIYVIKTPTKIAAASSTFIVCFSSLTGFLGYASLGTIDWRFILPAAVACFVGGQLGARIMSSRMKGRSIRYIFSGVLFLLCVRLILQAINT
jgi:uncharacterized membrane protein YfcA